MPLQDVDGKIISIQRLCRFESSEALRKNCFSNISIQRLCRFELKSVKSVSLFRQFQYNDCVGSRINRGSRFNNINNFNTTIVSVRAVKFCSSFSSFLFQYNDCVGSSLFDDKPSVDIPTFQYNDCVGSRLLLFCKRSILFDFNTTIVSVRGPLLMFEADNIRYFNTTIVSVRASLGFVPVPLLSLFQYNDCVGSRVSRIVFSSLLHNFNTTIVSVRVRKSSI